MEMWMDGFVAFDALCFGAFGGRIALIGVI